MNAPDSTRTWSPVMIAVVALFGVLGATACLLVRPEPMSAVAPLLGPWAGMAYGHLDCTMASAMPEISWGVAGLGVFAFALTMVSRRAEYRIVGLVLVCLWAVGWFGLAAMSALNSTS